jgi:16S rRNA (cytosine967-C5)-methyltransferase
VKPGVAVRSSAARVVAAVMGGESLDAALCGRLEALPQRDAALCRELCYGTLRFYPRLDALLSLLLARPLPKKEREIHALALIGLYQLAEMRVPAHAAVSATVDAATALRRRRMSGMLNAVLRRYQRESAALIAALPAAAARAQPQWLWDALERQWPEQREAIAAASNGRPPMTLRVNLARVTRDDYLHTLGEAGIQATAGALSPAAVTLDAAMDAQSLPGFQEGMCSVQDESAQLAALLLKPLEGERILDACAAPGGKTGHLLELAPGCGSPPWIPARRVCGCVEENLKRLDLKARCCAATGSRPPEELAASGRFDAMLVDVPCSATGVIRRHPDIKLLRRASDVPKALRPAARAPRWACGPCWQAAAACCTSPAPCCRPKTRRGGRLPRRCADARSLPLPDGYGESCPRVVQLCRRRRRRRPVLRAARKTALTPQG